MVAGDTAAAAALLVLPSGGRSFVHVWCGRVWG